MWCWWTRGVRVRTRREALHDTVEIVVKPLGRHLKGCANMPARPFWAMGGSRHSGCRGSGGPGRVFRLRRSRMSRGPEAAAAIAGNALAAHVPQRAGGNLRASDRAGIAGRTCQSPRRSSTSAAVVPCNIAGPAFQLFRLRDAAQRRGTLTEDQRWVVIVFAMRGRQLGLLAAEPLDMLETNAGIDALRSGKKASRDRR